MNKNLGPYYSDEQRSLHWDNSSNNLMREAQNRSLPYHDQLERTNPALIHKDAIQWLMQNAPEAILQSSTLRSRIRESEAVSSTAENPVAIAGLGIAILSLGITVFSGGDFSFTATPASYIHQNAPLHLPFHQHTTEFNIVADHPRIGFGNQDFWFNLSFEFNGHDIRDAKINVLRDKSSSLTKSTFTITFTPIAYSLPADPIAEIRFNIQGRWDPFGSGDFAFEGHLNVRADGQHRLLIVRSDENRVRNGRFTNGRTIHRQAPIQVTPFWEVFFRPDSDHLDDTSIREIRAWVQGLRQDIRSQVEGGTLPIVLHGYASTTASVAHNQDLARRRIQNVKRVLRDFVGSNAQFTEFNHGELQARTGDRVEARQERRVVMEVTYYG